MSPVGLCGEGWRRLPRVDFAFAGRGCMCNLLGRWALAILRGTSRCPSSTSIFGLGEDPQLCRLAAGKRFAPEQHIFHSQNVVLAARRLGDDQ